MNPAFQKPFTHHLFLWDDEALQEENEEFYKEYVLFSSGNTLTAFYTTEQRSKKKKKILNAGNGIFLHRAMCLHIIYSSKISLSLDELTLCSIFKAQVIKC